MVMETTNNQLNGLVGGVTINKKYSIIDGTGRLWARTLTYGKAKKIQQMLWLTRQLPCEIKLQASLGGH